MSNDDYSMSSGIPDNSEIAKEIRDQDRQLYEAAVAKRQREQAKNDEESKIVAESEKEYAKIRKEQLKQILFYGLSTESSEDLDKLLDLSNQLSYVDNQYDPNHKKRINILSQMDVLRTKISNAGRNLGDRAFTKETFYKSVTGDYLIFKDRQGIYHLYAGELGAFRTTDRSLQVDENGQPLKIFKQDRIATSPEIPIVDYETVIIKDPKDVSKPTVTTRPHKPLFPKDYVIPEESVPKGATRFDDRPNAFGRNKQ